MSDQVTEEVPVLTLQALKDMEPGSVIATGTVTDGRLHSQEVRWAAKRGQIHDWAIYYHFSRYPLQHVLNVGDKCFTEAVIKDLVPCDQEAFDMYRF